jgi:hypothetical protein
MVRAEEGWESRSSGLENRVKAIGPESSTDKGYRSNAVELREDPHPIHNHGVGAADRSSCLHLVKADGMETGGMKPTFKVLEMGLIGFVGSDHNSEFVDAFAQFPKCRKEHLLVLRPGRPGHKRRGRFRHERRDVGGLEVGISDSLPSGIHSGITRHLDPIGRNPEPEKAVTVFLRDRADGRE